MKSLILTLFYVLTTASLFAQSDFKLSDFRVSGVASQSGENCFQLVPDQQWVSGSIWHRKPLNFDLPFEMELRVELGCEDQWGADGIVLAFAPYLAQTGYSGEGMGFRGLPHSLGIEIDTYSNDHLNDPIQDHLALMAEGRMHHALSLAGPTPIKNVEDCKLHLLKVTWNPDLEEILVYLDGVKRLSYSGDIVSSIFKDRTEIYWGITAATGRYTNRHSFCIEKLENRPTAILSSSFSPSLKRDLKAGATISLKGVEFNSGSDQLSKGSFEALDNLYQFLKENPRHTISINGHTDSAGSANTNQRLSESRAKAVADYLKRKGISSRRIKHNGYGEKFPITSNSTANGRKQNRRVDVYAFIPQV